MAKITIHIQGYGQVKVKKPDVYNEKTYSDGVAKAVAKTCQLITPQGQEDRFHPVLGRGGYNA